MNKQCCTNMQVKRSKGNKMAIRCTICYQKIADDTSKKEKGTKKVKISTSQKNTRERRLVATTPRRTRKDKDNIIMPVDSASPHKRKSSGRAGRPSRSRSTSASKRKNAKR